MMPTERHMCPGCGDRVGKDWAFCQTCGYRLGDSELSSPAAESATAPRVGTRVGVVAAVVAVVLVVVGGGLLAARSILDQKPDGSSTELAGIEASSVVSTTLSGEVSALSTTMDTSPSTTRQTTTTTTLPTSTTVFGDLSLGVAMSRPECDGSFITLVGASVEPDGYRSEIARLLDSHPGSNYLRTDATCFSLRQELEGNPIYAVYFGPYNTFQEACDARSLGPSGSYVKRLDNVSDPNEVPTCG